MSFKARYLYKVTLFCSNKFGLGHSVQGGLEGNILQYYCKAVQIFFGHISYTNRLEVRMKL